MKDALEPQIHPIQVYEVKLMWVQFKFDKHNVIRSFKHTGKIPMLRYGTKKNDVKRGLVIYQIHSFWCLHLPGAVVDEQGLKRSERTTPTKYKYQESLPLDFI
jgi:hypothetical protein